MFSSMSRRSTPQQRTDELAFPVRVKIAVPPHGLGVMLNRMHEWLRAELGKGEFACHAAPGIGCDTAAFYFRTVPAARRFVEAFPDAVLADGTLSPAYASSWRRPAS
jgi:hypothetical protein